MKQNRRSKSLCATLFVLMALALALAPSAWAAIKYKNLHTFKTAGKGGKLPLASLIIDQAGNLYSTTAEGGTHGVGMVFELTPSADGGWAENVLYSFKGGMMGQSPKQGWSSTNPVLSMAPPSSGAVTELAQSLS